jgi:hypothetical protein
MRLGLECFHISRSSGCFGFEALPQSLESLNSLELCVSARSLPLLCSALLCSSLMACDFISLSLCVHSHTQILGLAIYNSVILDVRFPLVVYKKLLGIKPTIEDLCVLRPALGRGLKQLLTFEGDVENTYLRSFVVTYVSRHSPSPPALCLFTSFLLCVLWCAVLCCAVCVVRCAVCRVHDKLLGTRTNHELKPNGSNIPLTAANRKEYVDLYVDFLLNKSVHKQWRAFEDGFLSVAGGDSLKVRLCVFGSLLRV